MAKLKNIIALSDEKLSVIAGGNDREDREATSKFFRGMIEYIECRLSNRAGRIKFVGEIIGASIGYFLYYNSLGKELEKSLGRDAVNEFRNMPRERGLTAAKFFVLV